MAIFQTFLSGGTPARDDEAMWDGTIPWITSADIVDSRVQEARSRITERALQSSAANVVPGGTLLLVTRTSVGKVAIADSPLSFSQDITALRASPSAVDATYLAHFLRTQQTQLIRASRGATIKGVSREIVERIAVRLPALPEQLRIAEILDRAETLRAQRRQALALLDALGESIFLDMFGDPVSNPKQWPRLKLGEIGQVITGNTPSRAEPENYGGRLEWIKSDNLNTPHDLATASTEHLSEVGRRSARVVPPGSILVTCIAGSPACIGNAAMVDREVAFNQQINALVPSRGSVEFWFSQFVFGQKLLQMASTDGMKGMVSKSRFEAVEFIAPPADLQQEFAVRRAAIAQQKVLQQQHRAELDALFGSLQHRAFRGEL